MENSADNKSEIHVIKKSSESQPMHSKSDNREIMIDADTGEIIGELFNYL